MNIAIIGTGYLGLTTGVVMATAGHKVYCVDINEKVIDLVKIGKAPFYEPELEELLEKSVKNLSLVATTDYSVIADCDISFICVNTPSDEQGNLSLVAVKSAVTSIIENMNDGHIIVMKSTVPVGSSSVISELIKEKTTKSFNYVSNPEFLAESTAIRDTFFPDRIIIGTDSDNAYDTVFDIFKKIDDYNKRKSRKVLLQLVQKDKNEFKSRVIRTSVASAELIKVTANAFLAMKISFANSIAQFSDVVGSDINEVMDGIGADKRIGREFLNPGLGWGGGCFPKDIHGLIVNAKTNGIDLDILRVVEEFNQKHIDFFVNKANLLLQDFENKTITVWGLSFKPNTSDVRVSPSINLVKKLAPFVETIQVYDPKAIENARFELKEFSNIKYCSNLQCSAQGSDLIILATPWKEFLDVDLKSVGELMKSKNLLDCWNKFEKKQIEKIGFRYEGIGR